MTWQAIQQAYPHQWVLVEAIDAYTDGPRRVIEQLNYIGSYPDGKAAWKAYLENHRADRWREYYPLHTDRETLDIGIMDSTYQVVK